MKTEEITIRVLTLRDASELSAQDQQLVSHAKQATENAWAPYSQFKVGAALLLDNGEIITGNNQENSAYPSGLCAERVALFYASSQYPGIPVRKMAIAAFTEGAFLEQPVYPCGDCRQVLMEHENRVGKRMEVIMYGSKKIRILKSVQDLLPLPFIYKKD